SAIVVVAARRRVASPGDRCAAATAVKYTGKIAVTIVVAKLEFAQSYITHARSSRRFRPRRCSSDMSIMVRECVGALVRGAVRRCPLTHPRTHAPTHLVRPPGDPFAHQRIDDDIAIVLTGNQILAQQRLEG